MDNAVEVRNNQAHLEVLEYMLIQETIRGRARIKRIEVYCCWTSENVGIGKTLAPVEQRQLFLEEG